MGVCVQLKRETRGINKMDPTIILTGVITILLTLVANIIVLISWLRRDIRSLDAKREACNNEINKQIRDFQARLCTIEERNKNAK